MSKQVPQSNPWRSPEEKKAKALENLAAALARVVALHGTRYVNQLPEWMRDRDIRDRYFPGVSRSVYWQITKRPDFPKATALSPKVKLRRPADIEAWLAEQTEVA